MFYIIHQPVLQNVIFSTTSNTVFNNKTYTSALLFMIADTQVHYVDSELT